MVDKVFGKDFSNSSTPSGSWTLSVHNGTELVDITLSDLVSTAAPVSKNLILNGNMAVAQRGTSLAAITTTTLLVDRFGLNLSSLGTWTSSQEADGPSGTQFRTSLKQLVTTNDASPAASDVAQVRTILMGRDLQTIKKGTASAEQLTLSFWVKSNVTGTYVFELNDNDNTRQISKTYTISVANTWELKTLTFPADTTGAFDNDANASLYCIWWLGSGTNFTSGSLNSSAWAAVTNANRAVGQTNVGAANNNYFQITGVQLEVGASATAFESVPFDTNLRRCLQYYQKTFPYATAPAQAVGSLSGCYRFAATKAGANVNVGFASRLPVKMRASPTVTLYNPISANAQARDVTAGADCSSTASASAASEDVIAVNATGNASTAVGNIIDVHVSLDAELT